MAPTILTDQDIMKFDSQQGNSNARVLTDSDIAQFDRQTQKTNEEPSAYERVTALPGAANRSFLLGQGYQQGAVDFRNVPKYADLYGQDAMDFASKYLGASKLPLGGPQETALATAGYVPRIAGEIVDTMVDPFAGLVGLAGGPVIEGTGALAKGGIKGIDKSITSLLRRIAGKSSADIKLGRELMSEGGVGSVLSKTKAKEAYLGREIAPKAASIAQRRVSSMNPNALNEIGINPESNQLAQDLKAKFGLQEFPTKASADEFYSNMVDSTPNDVQIPTDNLELAVSDPANKLDSRLTHYIKSHLDRTRSTQIGTLEKSPLSKDEYINIRGALNNADPKGEIPAVQAVKGALDEDFGRVQPLVSEAKGRFQLSREAPKIENYLNKPKIEEEMFNRLRSSASPEKTQVRESLNRLLGPQGESLVKDVQAQRLAKEWYTNEASGGSMNLRANPILEAFKELAKPVPRAYEKVRAGILELLQGRRPVTPNPETPFITSSESPYVPPRPVSNQPINLQELARNSQEYNPPYNPITLDPQALEQRIRESVKRGEFKLPQELIPDLGPVNVNKTTLRDLAKKKGKK